MTMERKTSSNAQSVDFEATGGEDESSTEREGDDSHLHDDQKSPSYPELTPDSDPDRENDNEGEERTGAGEGVDAGAVGHAHDESPNKVEDLAKAGRPCFDTDAGQV